MDKQHSGLAFATLGIASLAVAGSCLLFNEALGSLSYVAASLAIFLAMLCATRFSALQRTAPATQFVATPQPKPRRETHRAHAVPTREDSEDDVVESRMAALHAAVESDDSPSTMPPEFGSTSFFAPPDIAPESSVVVIEESLDPALAQQFDEFRPPEPQAEQQEQATSVSLRQMDDIRAQIARLREESRARHAAIASRRPAPAYPSPALADPLLPGEPMAPAASAGSTNPFARTEFSGLGAPSEERGFSRTEYLGPVELKH